MLLSFFVATSGEKFFCLGTVPWYCFYNVWGDLVGEKNFESCIVSFHGNENWWPFGSLCRKKSNLSHEWPKNKQRVTRMA